MSDAKRYRLFIDGEWRDGEGGAMFPAVNPFDQRVWAQIPTAGPADVRDAIAAARRAFETWGRIPGVQRAKIMLRLADILEADADRMARLETTDNGKIIRETQVQMVFAARQFRFFAGYADKLYGS